MEGGPIQKPFRFRAGESGTSGSIFLFSLLHIQLIYTHIYTHAHIHANIIHIHKHTYICTLSCTRCYLICCLSIRSITKIHMCMYLLPKNKVYLLPVPIIMASLIVSFLPLYFPVRTPRGKTPHTEVHIHDFMLKSKIIPLRLLLHDAYT